MEITSDKKILEKINDSTYDINYGNISKGSNTDVVINFKDVSHVSFTKTCQCTTPVITILPEGGFNMKVSYDSTKVGAINQRVYERVMNQKNEHIVININLKGFVTQ